MPIPSDQMERAAALLQRREDAIPVVVREKTKLSHRTEGNSIVLFEFRRRRSTPDEWYEESIAKFTYVQKTDSWRLFWMNSRLKWMSYDELPEAKSFEELFLEVEADPAACFGG